MTNIDTLGITLHRNDVGEYDPDYDIMDESDIYVTVAR